MEPASSPSTSAAPPDRRRLLRGIALSLVAALALYAAAAVWSDVQALREVLERFRWPLLPAILALTLANYALRMVRWHWYLRLVGARPTLALTAKAFLLGLPMVATPGKVGELLKSWILKRAEGSPMSATMPTLIVERLVDGLAMMVLAGGGLVFLADERTRRLSLAVLAVLLLAIAAVQARPVAHWLLDHMARWPRVGRFAAQARLFYDSSYTLLRPRPLAIALSIGILSWALEGMAYYLVLVGVGVASGANTALTALFSFSLATVAGAVAGTPGGLGGVEAVLVGTSMPLLDITRPVAVAAALLIRLATLWFAVAIGLAAMARWPMLLWGESDPQRNT
jgi:uncharacterized protein (TIRG00374 family)